MDAEKPRTGGHESPKSMDSVVKADRRWALRRGIDLTVDVTDSSGFTFTARMTEISEEGCRIHTYSAPALDRNLLHQVKVTGLDSLGAYVIWTSETDAGLTFSTPLDPVTVRGLVTKSLYARLSRRLARTGQAPDELGTLPPFPFKD